MSEYWSVFGSNLVALSIYWPAKSSRASFECGQLRTSSLLCSVSPHHPQSPISFLGHGIMKKKKHFGSWQCRQAPSPAWLPAPLAEAVLDAPQRWHGQQRDPARKPRFTSFTDLFGHGGRHFGSVKVNIQEKAFNHLPIPTGNEKLKHSPSPRQKAPHTRHSGKAVEQ